MSKPWGLSMAGCEDAMRGAVQAVLDATSGSVRYLEIGVACGDTFARMCEQLDASGRPWDAIALDLPDGIEEAEGYQRAASCLDSQAFDANVQAFADHVQLFLCDSYKWLRSGRLPAPFSLTLIDGCHERICTAEDFLVLEPLMLPGGVVIFHDTAPWSQLDPEQVQPHHGEPLMVRAAVGDLGLLDGSRPGWTLLAEAPGQQADGGRGCMTFQKTR